MQYVVAAVWVVIVLVIAWRFLRGRSITGEGHRPSVIEVRPIRTGDVGVTPPPLTPPLGILGAAGTNEVAELNSRRERYVKLIDGAKKQEGLTEELKTKIIGEFTAKVEELDRRLRELGSPAP